MRRFSIRTLMTGVVLASLGLAALRTCSTTWSGAVLSVAFFALVGSLLGIAFRRGRRRAYWVGFATLGWAYILLGFTPWFADSLGQYLMGPQLSSILQSLMYQGGGGGFQSVPTGALGMAGTGGAFGRGGGTPVIDLGCCLRTAMVLEAMIWAALGGQLATYFASPDAPGNDLSGAR